MNQIKRFVGEVKKLEFNPYNLGLIFNIDKYGHNSTGIDIFPHEKSDGENLAIKKLKTKLFSLYMLEMFIAEASGKKDLFLDHKHYLSMQPPYNKIKYVRFSYLYNNYNSISGSAIGEGTSGGLDSSANLLMSTGAEQNDLQVSYESSYNRFYKIYASNEKVNAIFKERTGTTLKRCVAMAWALMGFMMHIKRRLFKRDDFIQYLSSSNIADSEVYTFLSIVSLTRDQFADMHRGFRKKNDGSWFTYRERMSFDRGLPKITFFYPLLRDGDAFTHLSDNAYYQFMKMNSFYRYMTENFTDINFKGDYAGPLFEEYAKNVVAQYNDRHELDGKVYGDEEYKVKKQLYKKPDIVFETDQYIIFVECKTSPYSLDLVRQLDPKYMKSLKEGVEKSIANIDRFMLHRATDSRKKTLKLLVFYEENAMVMSFLEKTIEKITDTKDLHIMGVTMFEDTFSGYIKPLPDIFEEFDNLPPEQNDGLWAYIGETLVPHKLDEQDGYIIEEIAREMGLEVT